MIDFLISVIILCIVFGLIYYLVTLLPLPEPFHKIATIAVLLVFILILLGMLVGGITLPKWPVR
jgi:hypothetical protein